MQPDARPGRLGYFAAAGFAIAGVAGSVLLVLHLLSKLDTGDQFIVPGSHAFVVEKPGKYLVWNDYRTVFQGRAYDAPGRLPDGLRIRVTELAGGKDVEVSSSRGATSTTAEAERVSIAAFEAAAPGRYQIVVEGDFAPRVFSVAPSFLPQLFLTIAGAVASMLLGLAAAVGLAVWTYLKRNPALPLLRGAPPPATAAPEESTRQLAMVVYGMQAASFLVPIASIAGIIINYVKREDVAGTWLESHFTWQIRTFWWGLAWLAVGIALALVVVGFVVWFADAVWFLYRIIKGWIRLSEGKPMYQKQ